VGLSKPVKKWAARHRWSRRLTTKLFGWQWRKIYGGTSNEQQRHKQNDTSAKKTLSGIQ